MCDGEVQSNERSSFRFELQFVKERERLRAKQRGVSVARRQLEEGGRR